MTLKELTKKPLPKIAEADKKRINTEEITPTAFCDKNEILSSEKLQNEMGFQKLSDGNYLVSMTCPMEGITPEMISWWFWWHPQKSERYKAWFPGEHYGVSFAKKDKAYFNQDKLPSFRENSQFPIERIGKIIMPLRIDFKTPESFGFSKKLMEENSIPLIVCGDVSAVGGLVSHTKMAHIFKKTENGLLLISRFWIGETLKNPVLRKVILNDDTAKGMAEHCYVEYRNLVEVLKALYNKS